MNLESCLKYLDYLVTECDRILVDRKVSGDELVNLITELQLFKDRVDRSELHKEIKDNISNFRLNYSISGVE